MIEVTLLILGIALLILGVLTLMLVAPLPGIILILTTAIPIALIELDRRG